MRTPIPRAQLLRLHPITSSGTSVGSQGPSVSAPFSSSPSSLPRPAPPCCGASAPSLLAFLKARCAPPPPALKHLLAPRQRLIALEPRLSHPTREGNLTRAWQWELSVERPELALRWKGSPGLEPSWDASRGNKGKQQRPGKGQRWSELQIELTTWLEYWGLTSCIIQSKYRGRGQR